MVGRVWWWTSGRLHSGPIPDKACWWSLCPTLWCLWWCRQSTPLSNNCYSCSLSLWSSPCHGTNGVLFGLTRYSSMEPLYSGESLHNMDWTPFFGATFGSIVPTKFVVSDWMDNIGTKKLKNFNYPRQGLPKTPYLRSIGSTYKGCRHPRKNHTKH